MEDEATDAIRSVFDAIADEGGFVPSLWRLEVANALNSILDLADGHGLTVYDAAYVELALRRALPLATLDGDMRRAGRRLGLRVLPGE